MQQEAADELVGIERHQLGCAVQAIVFPGETDLAVGVAEALRNGVMAERHAV